MVKDSQPACQEFQPLRPSVGELPELCALDRETDFLSLLSVALSIIMVLSSIWLGSTPILRKYIQGVVRGLPPLSMSPTSREDSGSTAIKYPHIRAFSGIQTQRHHSQCP
ncbi:hypothetical protein TNCV_3345311 [Trichonephila clavipes]|nr:hypothetical protein TNCV_3345311 [Trichonephila clavipes]